jgi:hypothetical protein
MIAASTADLRESGSIEQRCRCSNGLSIGEAYYLEENNLN